MSEYSQYHCDITAFIPVCLIEEETEAVKDWVIMFAFLTPKFFKEKD